MCVGSIAKPLETKKFKNKRFWGSKNLFSFKAVAYTLLYCFTHTCMCTPAFQPYHCKKEGGSLQATSSYSQQEVTELEQTCEHRRTRSKVITKTITLSHKCCAAVYSISINTNTSARPPLIKKLDPMELSQQSSCYCHSLSSQPPPVHRRTPTRTHTQARQSLHKHPHMTPSMRTHILSHFQTCTHKRTHEWSSMDSRVTLAPCFIKGTVTIGLLLL